MPGGETGLGLFAYLRQLQGDDSGDRRDVIATVFRGAVNRMINGYLLRDVINKVDEIHFASSEEIHTLGTLYESMLREMRDAAGDSGEFYTPRPVVRFMVEMLAPKIGEIVLDPACGTGGFLVESYLHLLPQAQTIADRVTLGRSVVGGEAKPLPYLLAQMNLLLHGVEFPQISTGNSLAVKVAEIGERERVDVILTNPPFGGEEERGILDNFPPDRQTAETALLFLQLIMRKLRRRVVQGKAPARAAVVVPNGILFAGGPAARIKEELLTRFNLHTIVRLPNGVFSPYTSINTNLLFFDTSTPSEEVWYYEVALPDGRKQFSKTSPIQSSDLAACAAWWSSRVEEPRAWRVPVAELLASGCNLDVRNPQAAGRASIKDPSALLEELATLENQILEQLGLLRELDAETRIQ